MTSFKVYFLFTFFLLQTWLSAVQGWTTPITTTTATRPISYGTLQQPQQQRGFHTTALHEQADDNISSSDRNSNNKSHLQNSNLANDPNTNVTTAVEKKIRVAKAQAEIDRILQGPDAPLDLEAELKKVVSIAPPLEESDDEDDTTNSREEDVAQLEHDLYQAVKRQDYGEAAKLKREINQQHIDDCGAVLQVNAAFYKAFSRKDFEQMEALWLPDGTATCIHPSSRPLVGAKQVLLSWKRMFEYKQGSFQKNWMEPQNIRLSVLGASTAIVSCEENVYARRFVRGQKRQTERINQLMATNIFRKVSGKWYLCHHHASWHADSEAAKQALRASSKPKPVLSNRKSSSSPSSTEKKGEPDEDETRMNGVLGLENFGPLLGDEKSDDAKKPVKKRIVMGSLSDIFNGDLSDLLNNKNNNDREGSDDDDENMGSAVIHFNSMEHDDEDDEDEDEELDDLTDDEEDDEVSEMAIIKQWSKSSVADTEEKEELTESTEVEGSIRQRQECITALRRLSNQGSISPRQKRVLLTDIISCAAKGEVSTVEIAYELLCDGIDNKDAADEEFADQCRVFAQTLPSAAQDESP